MVRSAIAGGNLGVECGKYKLGILRHYIYIYLFEW